ncbi:MAG: hypothetical protein LBK73_07145 [Treponema sp.]|jgi:hypothetical protein|nr:hypothetical protein [Treponema sp.]
MSKVSDATSSNKLLGLCSRWYKLPNTHSAARSASPAFTGFSSICSRALKKSFIPLIIHFRGVYSKRLWILWRRDGKLERFPRMDAAIELYIAIIQSYLTVNQEQGVTALRSFQMSV